MLQVLSLEQTLQREETLRAASATLLPDFIESGLTGHIRKAWETNKVYRVRTDLRLLECLRARRGTYSSQEMSVLQARGGSNIIWMDLTDTKARAAASWITDVLMPSSEKAWSIEPSPIPELPDEIKMAVVEKAAFEARQTMVNEAKAGQAWMSEEDFRTLAAEIGAKVADEALSVMRDNAARRAERMENKIGEHMITGGYRQAMSDFIDHFVTYPTAILKGPFFQQKDCIVWLPGWNVKVDNQIKMSWAAVNPFDCYPAPNARSCQEGDFIERLRLRREHLYAMIGLPGYNEDAIRGALHDYTNGRNEAWLWSEMERRRYENDTIFDWLAPHGVIDALHYWGSVPGMYLIQWGMDPDDIDPEKDYEVDAILIGSYVIRAALNGHPLKHRPYRQSSFSRVPGAFWGRSIFDLMKSSQKMCNAAACSLADNMGMACLTGDTVVYRHEKPGSKKPRKYAPRHQIEVTLNELWAAKQSGSSGFKRTVLRSLNEDTGKFFGNRLIDIFDNGVRPVYRLLTKAGYSIKATMNHRFLAADGKYQAFENFVVGDLISVNGSVSPLRKTCMDCDAPLATSIAVRCQSCQGKRALSVKLEKHPRKIRACAESTSRGRKSWRDGMLDACQNCGESERRLELHHVDKDPLNCAPSNRMTLCSQCHHAWHARHDNYGNPFKHTFADFDSIISIEYVGEEQVFDLQMAAPYHNFVANGLTSHNSGPMMWLYTDRLANGYVDINPEPWKIYQLASSKNGQDSMTNPGIGYIQTPSNAEELMRVFQFFEDRADTTTGIPKAFAGGTDQMPQVARTLSILMNAASKGLKMGITNIDVDVTEPTLYDTYLYEMLYGSDMGAKGDCNVVPRGAAAIMVKDAHLENRKQAWTLVKGDQLALEIMGLRGYAELMRETLKMLDVPTDKMIPSDDALLDKEKAQEQAKEQAKEAAIAAGQVPGAPPSKGPELAVKLAQQKTQRDLKAATIQKDLQVEAMKRGQPVPQPVSPAAQMALGTTQNPAEAGAAQ
jgi:hypothetical protein